MWNTLAGTSDTRKKPHRFRFSESGCRLSKNGRFSTSAKIGLGPIPTGYLHETGLTTADQQYLWPRLVGLLATRKQVPRPLILRVEFPDQWVIAEPAHHPTCPQLREPTGKSPVIGDGEPMLVLVARSRKGWIEVEPVFRLVPYSIQELEHIEADEGTPVHHLLPFGESRGRIPDSKGGITTSGIPPH
jgi:hypothetical protein